MNFLKSAAPALALLLACSPAMADGPVNNGGNIDQAITAAIAGYVSGAKGNVKGVAVWSNSGQRFWDPLTDSSGGGGGTSATAVADCNLPVAAGTGKPVAINLFSSFCVVIADKFGVPVDWTGVGGALYGANSATGTSATTFTGMGAQGASVKIYIKSIQCFRTDTPTGTQPAGYVTINDSASTKVPVPGGAGSAIVFGTPLTIAANTAATFTANAGVTTIFCNAQGNSGA